MAKIVGVLLKDFDEQEKEYDEVEFERCMGNALVFCHEIYVQGRIPEGKQTKNVYSIEHGNREEVFNRAKQLSVDADWFVELNIHQIFARIGIWGGMQEVCKKMKEQEFVEYRIDANRKMQIPTKMVQYVLFHISYLWSSHNLCRGHNPDRIGEEDYVPWYGMWKPLMIRNLPNLTFDNCMDVSSVYNKNVITSIEVINFRFSDEKIPEDKKDFFLHIVPDRFYPRNVLEYIKDEKIYPMELIQFIDPDEDIRIMDGFIWKKKVEYEDRVEVKDFSKVI